MDSTTALTGILPAIIILAAILTLVASAFLLWLYRRATIGGMSQQAMPNRTPPAEPDSPNHSSGVQLSMVVLQDESAIEESAVALKRYRQAAHASRNTGYAYVFGGLVYALVVRCVPVADRYCSQSTHYRIQTRNLSNTPCLLVNHFPPRWFCLIEK